MTPAEIEAMLEHLQARTSRIEQILPTLATRDDLLAMKQDLEWRLETGLGGLGARIDALGTRVDGLDTRMGSLDARMDTLDTRMDSLGGRIDAASRQVLVLHEDVRSDIRLLAEHLARVLERLGP